MHRSSLRVRGRRWRQVPGLWCGRRPLLRGCVLRSELRVRSQPGVARDRALRCLRGHGTDVLRSPGLHQWLLLQPAVRRQRHGLRIPAVGWPVRQRPVRQLRLGRQALLRGPGVRFAVRCDRYHLQLRAGAAALPVVRRREPAVLRVAAVQDWQRLHGSVDRHLPRVWRSRAAVLRGRHMQRRRLLPGWGVPGIGGLLRVGPGQLRERRLRRLWRARPVVLPDGGQHCADRVRRECGVWWSGRQHHLRRVWRGHATLLREPDLYRGGGVL